MYSLILLALLSASSAHPTFSSTLTLTLPWHPPPPPNSDLRLKSRMQMPDSPRPDTSSFHLGTQLPVSYRVAIALDAVVLLITILSLVGLGVYIRRQIQRRREGLLQNEEGYGFGSDDESDGDENGDGDIKLDVKEEAKERRKKGHVRWTSSVVGMGVFARLSVDEGRLKLEGGEGYKPWKYDARQARRGLAGAKAERRVGLESEAGLEEASSGN